MDEIWKQKKARSGARPVSVLINCRTSEHAYCYYLNSGKFGRISLVRLEKEFQRVEK